MPTVLRESGYRFFFFSNENDEPPHIHDARAGNETELWIGLVSLAANRGFASHEITRIARIVRERRGMPTAAWDEYFARRD
jgi:hypothetical protein